jgi:hypothetical protein
VSSSAAAKPAAAIQKPNLGGTRPANVCVRPTAGGKVVCGEVVDDRDRDDE